MDARIQQFIRSNNCATICCIGQNGKPHCFNCYYVCDSDERVLCFKSSLSSKHSVLMQKKSAVAGTIISDENNIGFLKKGLQFEGLISHNLNSIKNDLSELYYQRYPIAKEISGQMWFVQLNAIVMSNISKTFGVKLYWKRTQN